jgi:hypothetical protein
VNARVDRRLFQLYLLSRMRADAAVAEALPRLQASSEELRAAAEAAEEAGFEGPFHRAELYTQVLGLPAVSERDVVAVANPTFAGSLVHRYQLELWPEFDFVVRETRDGQPWGVGFARARGATAPPLASLQDLGPWRFVEEEVAARLAGRQSEDAWSGWEELSYLIPLSPGGPLRRYLLRFDFNLLQTIAPLDRTPAFERA